MLIFINKINANFFINIHPLKREIKTMALIKPEFLKQLQVNTINKTIFSATGATFDVNYGTNGFNYSSDNIYKDNRNYGSAHETAFELQKGGSSLFNGRILDNACNVENELSIAYSGIKGKELDKHLQDGAAVWTVDKREDTNNDGVVDENDELVTTTLLDAIVDSFDSELDLFIEAKFQEIVETYATTTDWSIKNATRAQMRIKIKDCLRKYGYPPEYREEATSDVIKQAEYIMNE